MGEKEFIEAAKNMPTLEGFILPYYVSTMDGTKYPVNIEDIYCDEFYNETVAKVAQAILEVEQIKED